MIAPSFQGPSQRGAGAPGGEASSGLSAFVADVMLSRGLTAAEVARRGQLPVATVAAIRAGTRGKRPRLSTLAALAQGLGVSLAAVAAAAGVREAEEDPSGQERRLVSHFWQLSGDDRELVDHLVSELLRIRRRHKRVARRVTTRQRQGAQ